MNDDDMVTLDEWWGEFLAALAVPDDVPVLVATVECPACRNGDGLKYGFTETEPGRGRLPCLTCHGTGTVRGVWLTEDVLRARVDHALSADITYTQQGLRDAIVRAIFGGDDE